MLYIVPADPTQPVDATVTLSLTQPGAPGKPDDHWQASGATVDGVVSTRRGWPWSGPGKLPVGKWELALTNAPADTGDGTPIMDCFKQGRVQDILFVVTYSGLTPPWPD